VGRAVDEKPEEHELSREPARRPVFHIGIVYRKASRLAPPRKETPIAKRRRAARFPNGACS
jgi:hypothetical protein